MTLLTDGDRILLDLHQTGMIEMCRCGLPGTTGPRCHACRATDHLVWVGGLPAPAPTDAARARVGAPDGGFAP